MALTHLSSPFHPGGGVIRVCVEQEMAHSEGVVVRACLKNRFNPLLSVGSDHAFQSSSRKTGLRAKS